MKGNISISRRNDGNVSMTIIDSASGRTAFSATFSPTTLGEALTGAARQDIDFELENKDIIGKQRETKHVWVKDRGKKGPLLKKKDVEEGWAPLGGHYGNHHYTKEKDGVHGWEISLVRYVEIPDVFEMEE
ncbi:MAG: hypothetical protein WC052_05815 [Patescibacteria group bacterium]